MKRTIFTLIFILLINTFALADEYDFNEEEEQWLIEHKNETFTLGLDPYSGMDYFWFRGKEKGYVIDLATLIGEELNIQIDIQGEKSWGSVYEDFINGKVDILFGANVTEERLKIMDFTEAIHKYPYAIFTSKTGNIKNIGDLDNKKVGFIEGDVAINLFKDAYDQLDFEIIEYEDQTIGLEILSNDGIDGFITSGGGVVYDFIYNYPNIAFLTDLKDITSDMTLATLKDYQILNSILSKVVQQNFEKINSYIATAQIDYNRKILNLTDEEMSWLNSNETVVVGVASDYLPFDYYEYGEYKGIAGTLINEISRLIGINFEYDFGTFDEIYQKALVGDVDLLNIAKTEERQEYFLYPQPFSDERDVIYGLKNSDYVQDIYGLENHSVAVIKGFWHEEFLLKNLRNVEIVLTESILDSLDLVNRGKVDYLIENPTVAEYYISGMAYWNLIQRGETSRDSFLYFGIHKSQNELASIIDKTLELVDYDKIKQEGLTTVPSLVSKSVTFLVWIVGGLVIVISIITIVLYKVMQSYFNEKAEKTVLKERESLMYIDPLTGLYNRSYYNEISEQFDDNQFPQAIIICDLNNLKGINDTYGHHVGDQYIKSFGQLLSNLEIDGHKFRMGGDEFLLLVQECDEVCADKIIRAITYESHKTKVLVESFEIDQIEVALGFHVRYNTEITLEKLGILADNLMYEHKNKMKNETP